VDFMQMLPASQAEGREKARAGFAAFGTQVVVAARLQAIMRPTANDGIPFAS